MTKKDSRVPWIGNIPASWEMRKVSRSFGLIGSGTTPSVADHGFHDEGTIPWVNTGDLNDGVVTNTEKRLTTHAVQQHTTLRMYPPGTVLVAKYGATIGKVGVLGIEACTNQACCALTRPKHFDPRFIYYWFLDNRRNLVALSFGGGQPNINQDLIRALRVQAPLLNEQRRIARYLDEETRKVDRLVALRRRQLELLREQRAALVQQTVTQGLDRTVQMKSARVEWLDQIPQHWRCAPLRRFWSVTDCKHLTVPFLDEGIPLASVSEVQSFELDLSEAKRTSEHFYQLLIEGGRQPRKGDVIYCRNTSVGAAAYVSSDELLAMGQDVCLIRSTRQNGRYLVHQFRTAFMAEQLNTILVGATFKRINVADIKALQVVCPPRKEQDAIVEFLDAEHERTERLVSSYRRQIDLLTEYRAALIHECVTGQRPVPAT